MMKPGKWLIGGMLSAAVCIPSLAYAGEIVLVATLAGANETAGGDPDGSGTFSAKVDSDAGDVCYVLAGKNIATPTAAHLHSGAAGSDGAPVLTLEVTGADLDECIAVEPDKLEAILAAPGEQYINIHTADFPKGAVRGQLSKK